MSSTLPNPIDDLVDQAADLLDDLLSLVHSRLAPPPKRDSTARLVNVSNALQSTVDQFQTSSFKCDLEAEITHLKREMQRFKKSVGTQLRDWERQQQEQHANEPFCTESSGLFPADVIGVIATFLPPLTQTQLPLMLVNRAWLQGVAGQDGMKPKPEIMWPYVALRVRDPAMLCLVHGDDRHVAELAWELPRLEGVQLFAPYGRGGFIEREKRLTDESLRHVGKLKHLTTLRIDSSRTKVPYSGAGMKHLANLRQLTSLSVDNCSNVAQLDLENFGHLTNLNIKNSKIPESVLDSSKGGFSQLTTLKLDCQFTQAGANHLKALKTLTSLDLKGNLYGTPMMEAIGELSGLVSLTLWSTSDSPSSKGFSSLTKLKCLKFLSAMELDDDDLDAICGIPTLTSLKVNRGRSLLHLPKLKKTLTTLIMCSKLSCENFQQIGMLELMTSLDVSSCNSGFGLPVSSDGWIKGFEYLAGLQHLDTLNISFCGICDEDMAFMAAVLPPTLKKLNLRGSSSLTDAGMKHVVQRFPLLTSVHLGYCLGVSQKMKREMEHKGIQLVED